MSPRPISYATLMVCAGHLGGLNLSTTLCHGSVRTTALSRHKSVERPQTRKAKGGYNTMSNNPSTTVNLSSTEEPSIANTGRNNPREPKGPAFFVNIEGTEYLWNKATITTEEIISLGGWNPSQGAILIDKDNNERTLQPGEIVELKPGMGFSKKVRFKRG